MDRYRTQRSLACGSMQTHGTPALESLLRAGGAERLRPQSPASVEFIRHIYPTEKRLCLSRRCNGLVQSTSSFASTLEQSGHSFLSRSVRGGHCHLRPAEYFQHRPRSTVHLTRVCECGTQQGHPIQHGRERESPRQYFCRTFVAIGKI